MSKSMHDVFGCWICLGGTLTEGERMLVNKLGRKRGRRCRRHRRLTVMKMMETGEIEGVLSVLGMM